MDYTLAEWISWAIPYLTGTAVGGYLAWSIARTRHERQQRELAEKLQGLCLIAIANEVAADRRRRAEQSENRED